MTYMSISESTLCRIFGGVSCIDTGEASVRAIAELEFVLSAFLLEGTEFSLASADRRVQWLSKFPSDPFPRVDQRPYYIKLPSGAMEQRLSPTNLHELLEQLGFFVQAPLPGYQCSAPARGSVAGAVMEATRDTLRELLLLHVRALAGRVARAAEATAFKVQEVLQEGRLRLLGEKRGYGRSARPLNFAKAAERAADSDKLLALLGMEPPAALGAAPSAPADAVFRDAALEALAAEIYRLRWRVELPPPLAPGDDCSVRLDLVTPANWVAGARGPPFLTPPGFFGAGAEQRKVTLPGVLRLMFPRPGPCAMFSLLNCLLLRALDGGPAGGLEAASAQPMWDRKLLEDLHSAIAAVALKGSAPVDGTVMWPQHTYLRLSQVREIFLQTCREEAQWRERASALFVQKKLLPPLLLEAQTEDMRQRLARIAAATAESIQPGSAGMEVKVPLGDLRLKEYDVAAEMFALLRVPVLHGLLPEPGSRVAQVLEKCPGVTNEDVQAAEGLVGLSGEEFGELQGYMRQHSAGLHWQPPLYTPAGLHGLAAALGPGGVGVLYGNAHFTPIYCWPEAEDGGGPNRECTVF